MEKLLRRSILLGAIAGAVDAARNYLRGETAATETVQMVFDDRSTRSLASNTPEGKELTEIARKVVEIGL